MSVGYVKFCYVTLGYATLCYVRFVMLCCVVIDVMLRFGQFSDPSPPNVLPMKFTYEWTDLQTYIVLYISKCSCSNVPFRQSNFFEDFHSDKNVNQNNYEGGRGGKSIFRWLHVTDNLLRTDNAELKINNRPSQSISISWNVIFVWKSNDK